MSTGLKGGAEAAIHAIREIFEQESTEAVILVDAENAFNKLNRQAALHNIQYLCPPLATVLINSYRKPSRLFITGGGEIITTERATLGDTLAMQFYGISITPPPTLISQLSYHITTCLSSVACRRCNRSRQPTQSQRVVGSNHQGRKEDRLPRQTIKILANSKRSRQAKRSRKHIQTLPDQNNN